MPAAPHLYTILVTPTPFRLVRSFLKQCGDEMLRIFDTRPRHLRRHLFPRRLSQGRQDLKQQYALQTEKSYIRQVALPWAINFDLYFTNERLSLT